MAYVRCWSCNGVCDLEKVVAAAYRFPGGRVRTGAAHFEIPVPRRFKNDPPEAGFVTDRGRFVGRKEALELARAARQQRKSHPSDIRSMMDAIEERRGLMAESLYPDCHFARERKAEIGEDAFVSAQERETPEYYGIRPLGDPRKEVESCPAKN